MTLYQGWTPTVTHERTIRDDIRDVKDMVRLIVSNLKTGFYKNHPGLLDLDLAELDSRHRQFTAWKSYLKEITPLPTHSHPTPPAMRRVADMEVGSYAEDVHTKTVANEGKGGQGWGSRGNGGGAQVRASAHGVSAGCRDIEADHESDLPHSECLAPSRAGGSADAADGIMREEVYAEIAN